MRAPRLTLAPAAVAARSKPDPAEVVSDDGRAERATRNASPGFYRFAFGKSEITVLIDTGDDVVSALEPDLVAEPLVAGARGVLGALDDRLRMVRGEEVVAPGIRSIPSPGHTPGHISVGVEGEGKQLLLTGDAIVFTHASFEHPEWRPFTDLDRGEAARSRKRLLERAVADEVLILGFHFAFPGLGYALECGDAFRWHPARWTVLS